MFHAGNESDAHNLAVVKQRERFVRQAHECSQFQLVHMPEGRRVSAIANLERNMIHERTTAGLAAARRQGRTSGRPSVVDDSKLAAAKAQRAADQSPTQIAKALGLSRATVCRHLGATGAPDQQRFAALVPSVPVKHPALDIPLDLAQAGREDPRVEQPQ